MPGLFLFWLCWFFQNEGFVNYKQFVSEGRNWCSSIISIGENTRSLLYHVCIFLQIPDIHDCNNKVFSKAFTNVSIYRPITLILIVTLIEKESANYKKSEFKCEKLFNYYINKIMFYYNTHRQLYLTLIYCYVNVYLIT